MLRMVSMMVLWLTKCHLSGSLLFYMSLTLKTLVDLDVETSYDIVLLGNVDLVDSSLLRR